MTREQACFKCGQIGYIAKECKSQAFCTKCQKEGHRADQIKCSHFKILVTAARNRRIGMEVRRDSVSSLASVASAITASGN